MYIYDMPYGILRELCRLLDVGDRLWKNLAGAIGYSALDIQFLELEYNRLHGSPTERLLLKWGQSNATVDILACKLKDINAIRALNTIKSLVSTSLKSSLYEDEANNLVINVNAIPLINEEQRVSDDTLPPPGCFKTKTNICNDGKNDNKSMTLFETLEKATNSFHEKCMIKQSGDVTIYEGYFQNALVAIKCLKKIECSKLPREFYKEIEQIQKLKHDNVINYKEVVTDGPFLCMVLPFMKNGSLRDRLDCKSDTLPLTWLQRHKILMEASNGLLYLHSLTPSVVHGNLKSMNILLGINMEAKLTDFKLTYDSPCNGANQCTMSSKFTKNGEMTTQEAYMPNEYLTNGFQTSLKTDIYSFGVRQYVHNTFEKKSNKLLILKDANASNWSDDLWIKLMTLGKMCTLDRKNNRPLTKIVNNSLKLYYEGALNCITEIDKKSFDDEPIKDTEVPINQICVPSNNTVDTINYYLSNMKTTEIAKLPVEDNTDIYSSNCNNSQHIEKPSHAKNFDPDIWPKPSGFSSKESYSPSDDIKRLKGKNLLDFLKSNDDLILLEEMPVLHNDKQDIYFDLKSSELGSFAKNTDSDNLTDSSSMEKSYKLMTTVDSTSVAKMLASDSSNFIQLSKLLAINDDERILKLQKLKERVSK